MKNLVYVLLFLPFLCAAQCPQDTVSLDNPAGNLLWSIGEPYSTLCPTLCDNMNRYNCWTLPEMGAVGFEGLLQFGCSDATPNLIRCSLVNDCRFLLWDKCAFLSAPVMGVFNMYGEVPLNTQACMYWDSTQTDSVVFYCKPTGLQHRLYDVLIMDLDTCGQLVNIDQAEVSVKTYQPLTELLMGLSPKKILFEELLKNVVYVETTTKKKVLMQ